MLRTLAPAALIALLSAAALAAGCRRRRPEAVRIAFKPGSLAAPVMLAIEMGATASDVKLTIHPHPTLSEMMHEAVLAADGRPLHI